MSRPAAKGWCPGAYKPMMSGDGLVVRVRPVMARLTAKQALGLCELSQRYGSGMIDLTSRANLQIRGVTETDHEALLEALNALDLLPDNPQLEARRNILIAPFWQVSDLTERLARNLYARLSDLPDLPAKFGFAIDTGPAPVFQNNSTDIRIERSAAGLIVRADGCALGREVTEETAIPAVIEMAHWFIETDGIQSRRMHAHADVTPLPQAWRTTPPLNIGSAVVPGPRQQGAVYGAPFGQIEASQLADLVSRSGCRALRVTPWRLFLTEDAAPVDTDTFVTRADDPILMVSACPGAPLCTAASVETRALARKIAGRTDASLHVSGCAKGCAHPRKAGLTLVGREGRFDLVKNGLPWDEPTQTGLTENDLLNRIGEF
ncbi:cobalamin biosynthesis protein CobG [Cognatishimia maritima]|uniref:Precorrin-3B synthase n=1 Tax=Cognatishimia maritima TaxID=870908 RepID=A0A1M5UE70_9RHOB|nr:cobalamin biosynthesis protein CobG [Cognatishimia maritima]SHH61257.1 precorrin-3B synthase [Cognatishimia maritima]